MKYIYICNSLFNARSKFKFKTQIFLDVTPCTLLNVYWRFEGNTILRHVGNCLSEALLNVFLRKWISKITALETSNVALIPAESKTCDICNLHRVRLRYIVILRMKCLLERIMSPGKWNNPVELSDGCNAAAGILHPPECNFIFCQKTTLSVFNTLKAETHLYTIWTIYTSKNTLYTRWFKYDRDWFVCKQAALRSSCATLREWSLNLHPPSCSG